MEQEKASLLQHIQEIEDQHKQTVLKLQHHVQEKEKVLAAEFVEAEQVYKTTEHDLRERLEEKTQIIEVIRYCFYICTCTCINCLGNIYTVHVNGTTLLHHHVIYTFLGYLLTCMT